MVAMLVVPLQMRETGPTAMRPALQPKVHVSPFVRPAQAAQARWPGSSRRRFQAVR